MDASTIASQFFHDVVLLDKFPLGMLLSEAWWVIQFLNYLSFIDYVGFVKRLLTLMHKDYKCLSKLEIELKQLEKTTTKLIHTGFTFF